ncbi:histidine kinase [Olivibacter sp. SDN3]|uniref:sensor histidine kinase n=1 Tax=Olivibacter sp. SDN3 TaxID=2764720 RepID=UPI001650D68F|nr:sensor histidine kinase [Olivibacter sp. SDN3]QNL51098.1 histidine kinase [Olivibacter sp. SDN3]
MPFAIDLKKKKILPWHVLGWLILITYEITFLIALKVEMTALGLFVSYCLIITLFYFHAYVVMPVKNSYWLLLFIPLEIVGFSLIDICFEYLDFYATPNQRPSSLKTSLIKYTYRALYFITFSTVYWLFMNTLHKRNHLIKLDRKRLADERKQAELEMKLVKSQNAKLRAQIEPHFVFNTMNFIYDSVEGVSEKAGETVLLLSEMMQYALQNTDDNYEVPLQIELENINKLIRINNIRTNNRLYVKLKTTLNKDEHVKTLPLLFITFVENMYKHGDLTDEKYPGIIYIATANGNLLFSTWNKKRLSKPFQSNSMGIMNAKERLINFYGNERFRLSANEDVEAFSVELKIAYAYD